MATAQELRKEVGVLNKVTAARDRMQDFLANRYNSKTRRDAQLTRLETATKAKFVTAQEYLVFAYADTLGKQFELLEVSLDEVASIRARLEGSSLFASELRPYAPLDD